MSGVLRKSFSAHLKPMQGTHTRIKASRIEICGAAHYYVAARMGAWAPHNEQLTIPASDALALLERIALVLHSLSQPNLANSDLYHKWAAFGACDPCCTA